MFGGQPRGNAHGWTCPLTKILGETMRHHATPHDHGHSVAAWTTVAVVLVGFMTSGFAVVAAEPAAFWLGLGIAALGVFTGKLLSMAGMGSMPSYEVQAPADTVLEGPTLAERPSQPVR